MPRTTDTPIDAYAHCADSTCPGNAQQPVKAIRHDVAFSYMDLGGDMPGIERTTSALRVAHDKDATCKTCGGPRELSTDPRPVYNNLSGHPQDGLLKIAAERAAGHQPTESAELAELRDQVAKLSALVAKAA